MRKETARWLEEAATMQKDARVAAADVVAAEVVLRAVAQARHVTDSTSVRT